MSGTPKKQQADNNDDEGDSNDGLGIISSVWDDEYVEQYVAEDGKKRWKCLWCNKTFATWNATKALAHVGKIRGFDVALCHCNQDVEHMERYKVLSKKIIGRRMSWIKFHEAMDENIEQHNDKVAVKLESTTKKRKSPEATQFKVPSNDIPSMFQKQRQDAANTTKETGIQMKIHDGSNPMAESKLTMAIADLIHSGGLPFSLAQDPKFRKVLQLARTVGSGYKPPGRNQVAGPLLDLNYETYMETTWKRLENDASVFGITFIGDGATVRRMPLINVLASSPSSPAACIEIVDCSSHMSAGAKKDARYVASLTRPHIDYLEEKEKGIVDLVYYDGAASVQKAGKVLEAFHPRIYSLHGSEHVMSLFFHDVFANKYMKAIYSIAQRAYNIFGSGAMHAPYAIFIKHSKTWNDGRLIGLMRAADTRMAGRAIVLMRLCRLKKPLQATINSVEFIQLKVAKGLKNILMSNLFWDDVKTVLRALLPGLHVLRLADKKSAAMDKLWYYVRRMDTCIEKSITSLNEMIERYESQADTDSLARVISYFVGSKTLSTHSYNELKKNSQFEDQEFDEEYSSDDEENSFSDDRTESDEEEAQKLSEEVDVGFGYDVKRYWLSRRKKLDHDISIAGWMLNPMKEVMADVKENSTGEHRNSVSRLVEKWFGYDMTVEDKNQLLNTFWSEYEEFSSKSGPSYEYRQYIWTHSDLSNGFSYRWHKMYTLPYTKVLGMVGCRVTSKILGIGSCERNWGDVKHIKGGKRAHLSGGRTEKQATIFGASCMEAADLKRKIVRGNSPYRFWEDEDFNDAFDLLKEDKEEEKKPERIFRAFLEEWEIEAVKKRDPVNEAQLLRKYGGLKLYDPDDKKECYINDVELSWTRPKKDGGGYTVLAMDENYSEDAEDKEDHVQQWFINEDLIWVIAEYYRKRPNLGVLVVKEKQTEDDDDKSKKEDDVPDTPRSPVTRSQDKEKQKHSKKRKNSRKEEKIKCCGP